MQHHRLAHQRVVRAEEIVDFFHGWLACDEIVDVAPERLCQFAANERFATLYCSLL
jgi:hypothetical protein